MRGRIIIAALFSLLISASTTGYEPRPILPLTKDHFTAVKVPLVTPVPKITETYNFGRKIITRSAENIPEVKVKVEYKSPTKIVVKGGAHKVTGLASYYCSVAQPVCRKGYPVGSHVAAAGPALRAAIGGSQASNAYMGKAVKVCGSKGCMDIRLVDWCQCYYKQPNEKLIDLYDIVFDAIGASKGTVTVIW